MGLIDLQSMRTRIGTKCQLLDSSGNIIDGLITTANLNTFINDRKDELFMELVENYPKHFEVTELIDTTDNTAFYAFSNLTTTKYLVRYVGIKYSSSDSSHKRVLPISNKVAYMADNSSTKFSTESPYYIQELSDGVEGIRLLPTPATGVAGGLYIKYVPLPETLTQNTDLLTNFPPGIERVIVQYCIADVWETKRDYNTSNQAFNRAEILKKNFFDNYLPSANDSLPTIGTGKIFNPYKQR